MITLGRDRLNQLNNERIPGSMRSNNFSRLPITQNTRTALYRQVMRDDISKHAHSSLSPMQRGTIDRMQGHPRKELDRQIGDVTHSIGNYQTRLESIGQEVPEHKKQEPNLLFRMLDIIDRPRNAIATGLSDLLIDGEGFFSGMRDGFTGQRQTYGSDMLKDLGAPEHWGTGVAGFFADAFMDPLNYVTPGAGAFLKGAFSKTKAGLSRSGLMSKLRGAGALASPDQITRNADTILQQTSSMREMLRNAGNITPGASEYLNQVDRMARQLVKGDNSVVNKMRNLLSQEDMLFRKFGDSLDFNKLSKLPDYSNLRQAQRQLAESTSEIMQSLSRTTDPRKAKGLERIFRDSDFLKNAQEVQRQLRNMTSDIDKLMRQPDIIEQILGDAAVATGKGLSIGGKQIMTAAQMQDLGAGLAEKIRGRSPVINKIMESIEIPIKKVFKVGYVESLNNNPEILKLLREADKGRLNKRSFKFMQDIEKFRTGTLGRLQGKQREVVNWMLEEPEVFDILRKIARNTPGEISVEDMNRAANLLKERGYDSIETALRSWGLIGERDTIVSLIRNPSGEALNTLNHLKNDDIIKAATESRRLLDRFAKNEGLERTLHNYAPHKMSDAAREVTKQNRRIGKAVKDLRADNIAGRARSHRGNVREVNERIFENYRSILEEEGFKEGDKVFDAFKNFFTSDPLQSITERAQEHWKYSTDKEFVDYILGAFGEKVASTSGKYAQFIRDPEKVLVVPKKAINVATVSDSGMTQIRKLMREAQSKARGKAGADDIRRVVREAYQQAGVPIDNMDDVLRNVTSELGNLSDVLGRTTSESEAKRLAESLMGIAQKAKGSKDKTALSGIINKVAGDQRGFNQFIQLDGREAELLMANIKNIDVYSVHRGVWDYLQNAQKLDIDEGVKVLQGINQLFLNLWKPAVTAMRPGFHMRNAIGSQAQNIMDVGFKALDPKIQKAALALSAGSNLDQVIMLGGKRYTLRDIRNLAQRENILSTFMHSQTRSASDSVKQAVKQQARIGRSGNQMADIVSAPFREKGTAAKLKAPLKAWSGAGRKTGDTIETWVRTTNFMAHLDMGHGIKKAAEFANTFHFDYSDLTAAERNVIRQFMPFYTWVRKNLPLQVQNLFDNPSSVNKLNLMSQNMMSAQGVETDNLPEWMKAQFPMAVNQQGDGRFGMFNPGLPMTDLATSPLEIFNALISGGRESGIADAGRAFNQTVFQSMSPLVKMPIDLMTGRNTLTGAPIAQHPGDNEAYMQYVVDQLGALRDVGRFVASPSGQREEGAVNTPNPLLFGGLYRNVDTRRLDANTLHQYNRQLGNIVQALEAEGITVPTMSQLEAGVPTDFPEIDAEILEIIAQYNRMQRRR